MFDVEYDEVMTDVTAFISSFTASLETRFPNYTFSDVTVREGSIIVEVEITTYSGDETGI